MTTKPMEGLAEWLRSQAIFAEHGHERLKRWASEVEAATAATGQEPVAWRLKRESDAWIYFEDHPTWHYENGFEVEPLYAHPPAQDRDAREALSDKAIECAWWSCGTEPDGCNLAGGTNLEGWKRAVRWAETQHGIIERARAIAARNGADTGRLVSDESDVALLKEARDALECLAIWANGSEAYPRLCRTAARLRARLEQK